LKSDLSYCPDIGGVRILTLEEAIEFWSHITRYPFPSCGEYTAFLDTFADTQIGDLYGLGIPWPAGWISMF
jgi:hypothetical protein